MSKNGALMASTVTKDLTQIAERLGDLPVVVGCGHTLIAPVSPKVVEAVMEPEWKSMFVCHRALLGDSGTIPVICLG